jgi:hypothetical protein
MLVKNFVNADHGVWVVGCTCIMLLICWQIGQPEIVDAIAFFIATTK